MNAAPKNPIILLIVVALVAGAWPAVLLGGIDLDSPGVCAERDDACEGDAESYAGSQPEDEDCCPTGCHDCYLACCAGMISLLPSMITMVSSPAAVSIVCRYPGDPSPARGREIDHPPQA